MKPNTRPVWAVTPTVKPAVAPGVALALALTCSIGQTQTGSGTSAGAGWQFGAVLDATTLSRPIALGLRGGGLGLGHSDLVARGTLGRHISAEGIAALAIRDGEVERGFERLMLQTRTLPGGLQMRVGRFASQVGYLNEQHLHTDDFVERPALHRAFLGHHYFDDGLRLNWTAPTPYYLQLGVEAFSGRKLVTEGSGPRWGVGTMTAKFGADLGRQHSWQGGLSFISNRRAAASDAHEGAHAEPAEGSGHEEQGLGHVGDGLDVGEDDHAHGAAFSGRRMTLVDFTWKWAPEGNSRQQQLRLHLEHARVSGLRDAALASRRHEATTLALVWRFRPDLEAGVRADRLRAYAAHEGHADAVRLNEQAVMLAYKPSHRQSLRLQWMTQGDRQGLQGLQGLSGLSRRTVALQYVVSFGAHGAHSF